MKTKSISKAQIIENSNDPSDESIQYDIDTCIKECGSVEQFLKSPVIVLYKRNLQNQGDLESYILNHLSSYSQNVCLFPGIKGTDEFKNKINEFYNYCRAKSINSTIVFKGSSSKTTVTQQVVLENKNLYLYVDAVMKNKTARNKKVKISKDSVQNAKHPCKNTISTTTGPKKYPQSTNMSTNEEKTDSEEDDGVRDGNSNTQNESEDIFLQETLKNNVSSARSSKGPINWKGGSKNCGFYLLYKKKQEVRECCSSVLSYAREHGVLLSGVQLKSLFDIQNVEITKDRANAIVQLISSSVDILVNPHFVPPTAKRPTYEYYGPNFELSEIYPAKSVPIPNSILKNYKKEKSNSCFKSSAAQKSSDKIMADKETELLVDSNNNSNDIQKMVTDESKQYDNTNMSTDEEHNDNSHNKLNQDNSKENENHIQLSSDPKPDMMNNNDAFDENLNNNNKNNNSSLFSHSNETDSSYYCHSFNSNIVGSSTPIKSQKNHCAKNTIPMVGETDSSIIVGTNAQSLLQLATSPISAATDSTVLKNNNHPTTDSSTTSPLSAQTISSGEALSNDNPHSNPICKPSTAEITTKDSSKLQQTDPSEQSEQNKQVHVKKSASNTKKLISNKRRSSFGFRPTTKKKRQERSDVASLKRKLVDLHKDPDALNVSVKKKKLNDNETPLATYEALTKAVGKIPKKLSTEYQ